MKKISVAVLLFVLMFFASSPASADKAVQLKLSHATPRTSTWHIGAEKFAEIIKERAEENSTRRYSPTTNSPAGTRSQA